jgi:hypothetical protein
MKKPPLSPPIRFMDKVIAGSNRRRERFNWHHILSAVHHLGQDHSIQAERLLMRLVKYKGTIPLQPGSDLPHSMSPESMIQSLALQSLLHRNKRKHRNLARRVAATTRIDLLAEIAKSSSR